MDFEFKGILFFCGISHSLTFCEPHGRKMLYPGGDRRAREDEIDLTVHDWQWWLIIDGSTELSCSHHGVLGNFLYFQKDGSSVQVPVTVEEAKYIKKCMLKMLDEAENDAGQKFKTDKSIKTLQPSNKIVAYRVKAYTWTNQFQPSHDGPGPQQTLVINKKNI